MGNVNDMMNMNQEFTVEPKKWSSYKINIFIEKYEKKRYSFSEIYLLTAYKLKRLTILNNIQHIKFQIHFPTSKKKNRYKNN